MIFLIVVWAVALSVCSAAFISRWFSRWSELPTSSFSCPFASVGLVILVAGSVIGFDFFRIPFLIPITIDRFLWGLAILSFLGMVIRGHIGLRPWINLDILLLAFLSFIAINIVLHDWSYKQNLPLSRFLVYYLMPVGLYVIIKNCRISDRELRVVAYSFCGFCGYLSVMAIAEVRGWNHWIFPTYIYDATDTEFLGRGRGPFLNPVSNGIFMTTGLATALLMLRQASVTTRAVLMVIIPLLVGGIVATLTRSVWLGMLVGVGGVVWLESSWRQRGLQIIAAAVTGFMIVLAVSDTGLVFKRDKHVSVTEMSQSAQLRPIFATVAWNMFRDRPIFGVGFGQYNRHKMAYAQDAYSPLQLQKNKDYVQHNVVLAFVTELGFVGAGLLILVLIKGIQRCLMLYRNIAATSMGRTFSLITLCLLVNYLINGMFHDVSIIPMVHMLLFYLLAMVVSLQQATEMSVAPLVTVTTLPQPLAGSSADESTIGILPQMPLAKPNHV